MTTLNFFEMDLKKVVADKTMVFHHTDGVQPLQPSQRDGLAFYRIVGGCRVTSQSLALNYLIVRDDDTNPDDLKPMTLNEVGEWQMKRGSRKCVVRDGV